ncbi:hypothetical protein D3C81_1845390 [compost metagenome]
MEHRRDGHVHIVRAQQRQALVGAQGAHRVQGVQDQLAVAEIHAFRVAGGTGGVEQSGHRILVEIREVELAGAAVQQGFVFTQHRQIGFAGVHVAELDIAFDGRQFTVDLFHQGHEVIMHQHQVVLGVVHGVEHLLR